MKVKITTIREFPSDQFYEWVKAANWASGKDPLRRLNANEFRKKRKVVFKSTDRIGAFSSTTAETTYEILED
jgi:hypothetical protein